MKGLGVVGMGLNTYQVRCPNLPQGTRKGALIIPRMRLPYYGRRSPGTLLRKRTVVTVVTVRNGESLRLWDICDLELK